MSRPPITCHVLDTTTGRPAASIPVTLTLLSTSSSSSNYNSNSNPSFTATTNADGRVTGWAAQSHTASLEELFASGRDQNKGEMSWALRFQIDEFYEERGAVPFFPEVEIRFVVRSREEHYHVPLLVGPFSYTTYRGS